MILNLNKHVVCPVQACRRVVERRAGDEGVELVAEVFVVDDLNQPCVEQFAQGFFRHLHGVAL